MDNDKEKNLAISLFPLFPYDRCSELYNYLLKIPDYVKYVNKLDERIQVMPRAVFCGENRDLKFIIHSNIINGMSLDIVPLFFHAIYKGISELEPSLLLSVTAMNDKRKNLPPVTAMNDKEKNLAISLFPLFPLERRNELYNYLRMIPDFKEWEKDLYGGTILMPRQVFCSSEERILNDIISYYIINGMSLDIVPRIYNAIYKGISELEPSLLLSVTATTATIKPIPFVQDTIVNGGKSTKNKRKRKKIKKNKSKRNKSKRKKRD